MGADTIIETIFKNCVDWQGRATRSEYWFWSLLLYVVAIVAVFLMVASSTNMSTTFGGISFLLKFSNTFSQASILIFILNFGVSVRRLHDTGRSGWWYAIIFVPYVGVLSFFVMTALPSQTESNEWGDNPTDNNHKNSLEVDVDNPIDHLMIDEAIARKLSAKTRHSIKKTVSTHSTISQTAAPVFGKR